jgi:hypothetical protein
VTNSTFDSLNDNVIIAQDQDDVIGNSSSSSSSCYHYYNGSRGSSSRRRFSIKVKAVYSWLHHMSCRGTTTSHTQSASLDEEEESYMKSFQNWIEVKYTLMMNI